MEQPHLIPRLLRPLGNPTVALLWGGLTLASLGDQTFSVVLSWTGVAVLGERAGYLAAVQAAGMLSVALLLGGWIEAVEHRRMMVIADLLRVVTLGSTAALWFAAGGPVGWSLFIAAFLMMAAMALYRPAMQTVLPGIVRAAEDLPATNALADISDRLARMLGPALVGIATLPLAGLVGLAACGFVVSGCCNMLLARRGPRLPATAGRQGVLVALATGFRALRPHPLLWFIMWANLAVNGGWFVAFYVALPLLVERAGVHIPGGAGGLAAYGLIMAAYGGANLLATLWVGSLGIAALTPRLAFRGIGILGIGIIVMGIAGMTLAGAWLFPVLLAGAAVSALGGPLQDVTTATLRQLHLPRRDLGAAVRAYMVLNQTGSIAAMLAAPSIIASLGVASTLALCGLTVLAVAIVGLLRFRA